MTKEGDTTFIYSKSPLPDSQIYFFLHNTSSGMLQQDGTSIGYMSSHDKVKAGVFNY